MTVTRNGDWGFQDYTPLTTLIERTDNALEALGLFEEIYGTSTTAEVERITEGSGDILAKERNGERNYAGDESARKEYFQIPFYPYDKLTKANDVQDFREYGTADTPASVEMRVEKNLVRIGKDHEKLKRKAMYTCLKGDTFANGYTGTQYNRNFATVWGVTGDVFTGGIDFTNANANPAMYIEKNCREHITGLAQDDAGSYVVAALCGSGFFNSLENHPSTQGAFSEYLSVQEPLRNRMAPSNGNAVGRIFDFKGTVYIEDVSGQIARDDAYVLPIGIADMFLIQYAPANTLAHANTVAEKMYMFLKQDERVATLETETSFQVICTRPELICILNANTLLADA